MADLTAAYQQAIKGALVAFGLELEKAVAQVIKKRGHVMDGDLLKSINSQVDQVDGAWRLLVGPDVDYALWVHEGTDPHWPPYKPIRRWVRKKLGVSGMQSRQVRFTTSDGEDAEFEAQVNLLDETTRAMQAHIAEQGTEAHPFLLDVLRIYRGKMAGKIADGIEQRL